ncbi:hypothetical protein P7K49_002637 [Saguinus oedipus]|uniref:Uncharacterized protein n=1 Tax=Saguinus oedipus TaxID=9490 RepID=A0ABQ9WIV6_SAGOE|nr:hypothetical protein P7K49_002637 [Saguinus oedipus]
MSLPNKGDTAGFSLIPGLNHCLYLPQFLWLLAFRAQLVAVTPPGCLCIALYFAYSTEDLVLAAAAEHTVDPQRILSWRERLCPFLAWLFMSGPRTNTGRNLEARGARARGKDTVITTPPKRNMKTKSAVRPRKEPSSSMRQ